MLYIKKKSIKPFDFEGLKIRDFTPKNQNSASVAVIEVPPKVCHRLARSRRSDKYYMSLDGTVSFRVEDQEVLLFAGDLLIVERNEWFSYSNDQKTAARLLLIHVPPFDLDQEEFYDDR